MLPNKLIVCYADWAQCDNSVLDAAVNGCNIIVWFAINFLMDSKTLLPKVGGPHPNLDCVANIASQLKSNSIPTWHMISVGGWNAPHPDRHFHADDVWMSWKTWNAEVVAKPELGFYGFDGLDWDLEGNDDAANPSNYFHLSTLALMGRVSQLAKSEGYIVGMAPMESYLDVTTPHFDGNLLHAYPEWKPLVNFHYHGRNCYAYLLAHFGLTSVTSQTPNGVKVSLEPTFDFVSLQLYESYSHINFAVTQGGVGAATYLEWLVKAYAAGWTVFLPAPGPWLEDAPRLAVQVAVPPPRLVLGVANAWAARPTRVTPGQPPEKALFIPPEELKEAWERLSEAGVAPRGFMFWSIKSEGIHDPSTGRALYLAADLNAFLHTRPPPA